MSTHLKTGIIVIHQLPKTSETLERVELLGEDLLDFTSIAIVRE